MSTDPTPTSRCDVPGCDQPAVLLAANDAPLTSPDYAEAYVCRWHERNIAAGLLREQEPAQGGLTETEQETLDEEFGDCFTVQWHDAINRLLAARGGTAAAGDEGLRERTDALSGEVWAWLNRHDAPWSPSDATVDDLAWRMVEALDATPAPTEDPAPAQGALRDRVEALAEDDAVLWRMGVREWDIVGDISDSLRAEVIRQSREHVQNLVAALAATTPEATGRDGGPA